MAAPKTRRRKTAGRSATGPRSHLGARRPERYDPDSWVTKAEVATGEWARDIAHRGRQAKNLAYKKRKKVKPGKGKALRVAGRGVVVVGRGVVGGTAAAVAGTYLTVRWTAKHANRARKAAAPHVNRAVSKAGRAIHTNAVVYGDAAARRAVRMRARNRARMRKMRAAAANKLDQAHTHAISKGRNRTARAAMKLAVVVAPRNTKNPLFRAMKPSASKASVRAEEAAMAKARAMHAEDEAMRKAREVLGRKPSSPPRSSSPPPASMPPAETPKVQHRKPNPNGPQGQSRSDEQLKKDLQKRKPGDEYVPGWKYQTMTAPDVTYPEKPTADRSVTTRSEQQRRTARTSSGRRSSTAAGGGASSTAAVPTGATNRGGHMAVDPIALIERGFAELAEYQPEDYVDWVQLLMRLSGALRSGAEGITVLAVRMDVIEKMDERALEKLYMAGGTLGAGMVLVAGSAKDFLRLYHDRLNPDSGRGRTMKDEKQFFGGK